MLAIFQTERLNEMLALTNGHMDHLAYVAKYIRYKRPFKKVTPDTVREALIELRKEGYAPPPPVDLDTAHFRTQTVG